jgi:hypothetical protein
MQEILVETVFFYLALEEPCSLEVTSRAFLFWMQVGHVPSASFSFKDNLVEYLKFKFTKE